MMKIEFLSRVFFHPSWTSQGSVAVYGMAAEVTEATISPRASQSTVPFAFSHRQCEGSIVWTALTRSATHL